MVVVVFFFIISEENIIIFVSGKLSRSSNSLNGKSESLCVMLPVLLKGGNSSAADWMNLEYENDPETYEQIKKKIC